MKTLVNTKERGFSVITMLLILQLLGLMLLAGFHQLMNTWQKNSLAERRYYAYFNQASSSLSMATTVSWQAANGNWQCQLDVNNGCNACIKRSHLTADNFVLIRGGSHHFYLYALAYQQGEIVQFGKGHWLDYCPEKNRDDCE